MNRCLCGKHIKPHEKQCKECYYREHGLPLTEWLKLRQEELKNGL